MNELRANDIHFRSSFLTTRLFLAFQKILIEPHTSTNRIYLRHAFADCTRMFVHVHSVCTCKFFLSIFEKRTNRENREKRGIAHWQWHDAKNEHIYDARFDHTRAQQWTRVHIVFCVSVVDVEQLVHSKCTGFFSDKKTNFKKSKVWFSNDEQY